jgi:hypothetical protein
VTDAHCSVISLDGLAMRLIGWLVDSASAVKDVRVVPHSVDQ